MTSCNNQGCFGLMTDICTEDNSWIRVCPVCGKSEKISTQFTPDEGDRAAGRAYAYVRNMAYEEAERDFLEAHKTAKNEVRKNSYLLWAVKCCFGVEYVRETLYKNTEGQRYEYVPIFARFPYNRAAITGCETTRLFEEYRKNHSSGGPLLLSLYTIPNLYAEAGNQVDSEEAKCDIFIAWHDRDGRDICQRFAHELHNWFSEQRVSRVNCFVSCESPKRKDDQYYEPHIYAALAKARVVVIVIDDYDALGEGFLAWEIRRIAARKTENPELKVLFRNEGSYWFDSCRDDG